MGKGYIPGRIGGDDKVLARWQKYASDSSYHGGKPQMQGSEGRMTGRDTSHQGGPRTNYPGAKDDVNG